MSRAPSPQHLGPGASSRSRDCLQQDTPPGTDLPLSTGVHVASGSHDLLDSFTPGLAASPAIPDENIPDHSSCIFSWLSNQIKGTRLSVLQFNTFPRCISPPEPKPWAQGTTVIPRASAQPNSILGSTTQPYKRRSVQTGLGKGDSGQFCYSPEAVLDGGSLAQRWKKVEIWQIPGESPCHAEEQTGTQRRHSVDDVPWSVGHPVQLQDLQTRPQLWDSSAMH